VEAQKYYRLVDLGLWLRVSMAEEMQDKKPRARKTMAKRDRNTSRQASSVAKKRRTVQILACVSEGKRCYGKHMWRFSPSAIDDRINITVLRPTGLLGRSNAEKSSSMSEGKRCYGKHMWRFSPDAIDDRINITVLRPTGLLGRSNAEKSSSTAEGKRRC
jgi:hypothetical protein